MHTSPSRLRQVRHSYTTPASTTLLRAHLTQLTPASDGEKLLICHLTNVHCTCCLCTFPTKLFAFPILTLILRFYFYTHVFWLGVQKSPPTCLSRKTNTSNVVVYNGNHNILNYHKFKESGPNDCDNDQQPKVHVAIWPPKPNYLYLWNYGR